MGFLLLMELLGNEQEIWVRTGEREEDRSRRGGRVQKKEWTEERDEDKRRSGDMDTHHTHRFPLINLWQPGQDIVLDNTPLSPGLTNHL